MRPRDTAKRFLEREVTRANGFGAAMLALIAQLDRSAPNAVWHRLASFEWERELASLASWLTRSLVAEPPSEKTGGFLFGVHHVVEGKETLAELHVAGFGLEGPRRLDLDKRTWSPTHGSANSAATREISRRAHVSREHGPEIERVLCLAHACIAAVHLTQVVPRELWLGAHKERPLAAGFPEGDVAHLGVVRRSGFRPDFDLPE